MSKSIFLLVLMSFFSSCLSLRYTEVDIGTWSIKNGEISSIDSLEHNELADAYWDLIESVLPKDVLDSFVVSLHLFTDGPDEALAAISSINDSTNHHWEIHLDTFDLNHRSSDSIYILDYTHALIHEFGHLITLTPDQIKAPKRLFQDYFIDYAAVESYAHPNSYLGRFIETYWMGDHLLSWENIDWMKNQRKRARFMDDYYYIYEDRHVTPYSSDSPEEDIAESWTFFVLSDKPTKEGIKYDKIRFFYEFPTLIKYREEIRAKLKYIPEDYLKNYNVDGPYYSDTEKSSF